jgi:hypothetical protein
MKSPEPSARAAALLMWVTAAGFGIPAIPCAHRLLRTGQLPSFFGLFRMYEGPALRHVSPRAYAALLYAFTVVSLSEAAAGRLLWQGRRKGARLSLLLLPGSAAFWVIFALPCCPSSPQSGSRSPHIPGRPSTSDHDMPGTANPVARGPQEE